MIIKALRNVPGVGNVGADVHKKEIRVHFDSAKLNFNELAAATRRRSTPAVAIDGGLVFKVMPNASSRRASAAALPARK